MVKYNASVFYFHDRLLWISDIRFLIQHFCDTSRARHTHCDHNEHHGEHHEAHQNIHTIGKKAHQFPGCQSIRNDHFCAEPADPQDTRIYGKLHQRRIPCDQALCLYKHVVDILTCLFKFLLFVILSHICFYHTDRGYVLLHAGIQVIVFFKYLVKIFCCLTDDERKASAKNDHRYQIDRCQFRVDRKRHHHRADHAERRAHAHTQDHLIGILDIGYICGKSCDQTRRRIFINVGKAECLDIFIHRLS